MTNLPTTWKQSWVLPQSSLGGRIAGVVRETADGEYWVAVMATPGPSQSLSIPLTFLPSGTTYNADVYADRKSASSLSRTTTTVTDGSTLTPTLSSGGGYMVRITTKAIENPSDGSSPDAEVYPIATEADLALITQHPDATFNVTADITTTSAWTPVPIFTGTINGNGHTIEGLTVAGDASKAFINDNQGTIRQLGFTDALSVVTGAYVQTTRVAVVAVTNDGTIDQVYAKDADVEGGWRAGPIAAENNGTISNSYTIDSRVVGNWESGALVGFNSATGLLEDNYVSGASVTSVVNNGGILSGYGYSGTEVTGNVVYSGALTIPSGANLGRINGRENGTPKYTDNLALNTSTINNAVVSGTSTDKNGLDTTAAQLATQSTYEGIGWNFDTVWKWDATLKRPVLLTVAESANGDSADGYELSTESSLRLIGLHPAASFTLTADITMTQPWTPVSVFSGKLNGNGHTIDGLTVSGTASKAFVLDNKGTISKLGFTNAKSIVTGAYVQTTRVALVAVTNDGTIDQVYTRSTDVEGGWRTATIAAENNATISNSYVADATVVSDWETGAIVGWNQTTGVVKNTYVVGAKVTAVVSNGGVLSGYGYAGTKFTGNVIISGALTIPTNGNLGLINARENGTPTYSNNLSVDSATINGAKVTGGTLTNKSGKATTAAVLATQAAYSGIGWDFDTVWKWDTVLSRPTLASVREVQVAPKVTVSTRTLTYQVGSTPVATSLLAATGAATDRGTLSIDTSAVTFTSAGTYTATVTADYDGTTSIPVSVTIRVVPIVAINVLHSTVHYTTGTSVDAARVQTDAGVSLSTDGTITTDLGSLDTATVGTYDATVTATDAYGFAASPVTITVMIEDAPAIVPTVTTLTTSAPGQAFGGPAAILRASVSGGTGTLVGSVDFFEGSTKLATVALEAGTASYRLPTSLPVGDHVFTAAFVSSEEISAGSTSATVSVTVAPASTITTVKSSVSSQIYGDTAAVLTATVFGGGESLTGSVDFYEGSTKLASVALESGSATYTLPSPLTMGAHQFSATFVSSKNTSAGSTSDAVTVSVSSASSVTTLGTTTTTQTYSGVAATVTATVTGQGTLAGTVAFSDGSQRLAVVAVVQGKASYTLPRTLTVGKHNVTAEFLPAGSSDTGSTSAAVVITVNKAPSMTALGATKKAQTYAGVAATLTATVTSQGTPAGTVAFRDGSKRLAVVKVLRGKAVYTLPRTLAVGKHNVTAQFLPSGSTIAGSTSKVVTIVVSKATSTTTLKIADKSLHGSQKPKATVTVKAAGTSAVAGTVRIYDGKKLVKAVTLKKGQATVTLPKLARGTHHLHAVYVTNATVSASTSLAVKVTSAR